ncbi:MAG: hypothetical protein EZS28_024011 [Streblomastix strix]|uniref:Cyclin N-terminal domain-containing protein n=1 Tax=Streblomastix strix TaxID=222440 RepID=A0A5J4VD93_9EUKA|nr:MAG: hypothetical protein EZS28_024011 [Streblomastix strix]
MQSCLCQFQDANSETEKRRIADDMTTETEQKEISDDSFLKGKQSHARKKLNVRMQLIALKLFRILIDAVPNASDVVSTSRIMLFFKYMKLNMNITIDESISIVVLLQRFVSKQTEKSIQILSSRNIGTMLVVLAIVAIKANRDYTYKNRHFAKEFGIPLAVLNESENAFMKIMDNTLFIDESEFSHLQNEIFKI